MLWFIETPAVTSVATLSLFKYILCYGSSNSFSLILKAQIYLNTSYVMVHLCGTSSSMWIIAYLNTSYVMVHPVHHPATVWYFYNLNTSYVMVHLDWKIYSRWHYSNLNTSYVMVHPLILSHFLNVTSWSFQYLSCFHKFLPTAQKKLQTYLNIA